jgi:hypothetical protein
MAANPFAPASAVEHCSRDVILALAARPAHSCLFLQHTLAGVVVVSVISALAYTRYPYICQRQRFEIELPEEFGSHPVAFFGCRCGFSTAWVSINNYSSDGFPAEERHSGCDQMNP